MSQWTVKTIKEHFDALRKDDQDAIEAALAATEKAIEKRDAANEKRFESVNEFRQTLTDQAGTFISRVEFNALKERMDRNDGKGLGISAVWAVVLGLAALAAVGTSLYAALH